MKNLYQVFSILLFIIFFSGCGEYLNLANTSGVGQHLGNRVYDEAKQRAINKGINMLFDKLF
jgi:hypothetical protein